MQNQKSAIKDDNLAPSMMLKGTFLNFSSHLDVCVCACPRLCLTWYAFGKPCIHPAARQTDTQADRHTDIQIDRLQYLTKTHTPRQKLALTILHSHSFG